ncbi:MAG: 2TM domain-containing protein [Algibacter sp.]|uniref:2TM domain-containing protein n=1 Tax=Algibacter sp. TaxID=1872428 RepID=UPI00263988A5|nr:2TM domain-containing protein [Algibacter sp.]MDG1728806.1 2TM domain-containing protein [Algibacter sp.]MDG2177279.1 2TM domain-containing protein [Algibacter sp.]
MENYKLEPYENKDHRKEQAYVRAKKRVKELKGFYWHAFWYVAVNIFIVFMIVSNGGDLFHFGTYSTALFWGIGLGFHALGVFGKNVLFNKSWEERKIKEYMDNDKEQWK